MNRLYAILTTAAAKLGWPGALGASLLVFAGSFYFSALRSQQAQLEAVQQEIFAAGQAVSAHKAAPLDPEGKLVAFYGLFPRPADLPDLLEKVFASAKKQGLRLEQGEYRVQSGNPGDLIQFRLALPVRGSYAQIRKFIAEAMGEVSALSLEGIEFERQKVDDGQVDAKVKFAVYLGGRQ